MLQYRPDAFHYYQSGIYTSGEYMNHLLKYYFQKIQEYLFDGISDMLPLALTVAGAILVVTLGWRLFRNFTRG